MRSLAPVDRCTPHRSAPIVEHLTRLERLPARGFRFTAVPPEISGAGTFTALAYATVGD